jgi:hypothetical protein
MELERDKEDIDALPDGPAQAAKNRDYGNHLIMKSAATKKTPFVGLRGRIK